MSDEVYRTKSGKILTEADIERLADEAELGHPQIVQRDLLALFKRHGLNVAVGLTREGVAIRSQDPAVDAANIGPVTAYTDPPSIASDPGPDPLDLRP